MKRPRVVCAACLAAVWTATVAAQPSASPSPADDLAVLEAETTLLERRLELAHSDVFYLFLDPTASDIALMHGGAVLQRYPVASIEVGRPRRFFSRMGEPPPWQAVIWENGTLTPPRPIEETEMTPPAPGVEEPPAPSVPPTAEEAIPVPMRYRLRFDGGLALEIVPPADPETVGWWTRVRTAWAGRWQDVRSVLRSSDRDSVRVRVTLGQDAARSLYRSVPPHPKLLIASLR